MTDHDKIKHLFTHQNPYLSSSIVGTFNYLDQWFVCVYEFSGPRFTIWQAYQHPGVEVTFEPVECNT